MNHSWVSTCPSPLKILLFLVVWSSLWCPVAIPLARRLDWCPPRPVTTAQKLPLVLSLYLLAPVALWGASALEGSSLAGRGLAPGIPLLSSLASGFLLATASLAIVFGIEGWLGWLTWKPENLPRALSLCLPLLFLGIGVGVIEETIFRGLFLDWLRADYGGLPAAILAGAIFAVVHLFWERRETLFQLPGLWLMGMVLALARASDGGSLGLPWGLHAGWVWGSALLDSAGLLSPDERGPSWIVGANNHPLAGLAGFLCLAGTGLGLFLLPQ